MSKVFITDYIEDFSIETGILGRDVSAKVDKDIEVLLVWHQQINEDYLSNFPNLKGVVRYGVGYDNIDLGAIKKRQLIFCNTPDYGTDEVSDTALGMILSLTRGINSYNIHSRNFFDNWQENTIPGLRRSSELTIGIIGAGRIGTSLMRKANSIGFNISFFDPYKPSGYEKAISVSRYYSLEELVANSDIISIHTPLTDETFGMVNADFINLMKEGAFIVNTARGEIIESLDLIYYAILNRKISGVGLDVLPSEPPKSSLLIDSWRESNTEISSRVIINPHTSYFSEESYREMRVKAAENSKRIIEGIRPFNIIVNNSKNFRT